MEIFRRVAMRRFTTFSELAAKGQRRQSSRTDCIILILLCILAIIIISLYVLSFTSCTFSSSKIPASFLAQIQKSDISVQIGFYGICNSGTSTCTPTPGRSAATIATTLFPADQGGNGTLQADMVKFALDLQQRILISPLIVAAALFLVALLFVCIARAVSNRQTHLAPPRKRLTAFRYIALGLSWLSTALAMTATMFGLEMVNELQYAVNAAINGESDMSISVGTLLEVVQLVIFVLEAFFSLFVMFILRVRTGARDEEEFSFVDRPYNSWGSEHVAVI